MKLKQRIAVAIACWSSPVWMHWLGTRLFDQRTLTYWEYHIFSTLMMYLLAIAATIVAIAIYMLAVATLRSVFNGKE